MDASDVARFARQIALPEVGPDGQERIGAARVLVAGGDRAAEVAVLYLRAAGVGAVIELSDWPPDGAAWLRALEGIDVVVRSGFDDDAMLAATRRLGLPAVVVRAQPGLVDLLSTPRRPPAPDVSVDVPSRIVPREEGAAAVVAGTLAAAEALHIVLRDTPAETAGPFARHLRLPLDGGAPVVQEIGAR